MIGIDVGKARVGVARCDDEAIMAVPVTTLRRDRWGGDIDEVARLVDDYAATRVVVGLPSLLSGAWGAAVDDAISWAEQLSDVIDVPIRMVDERLTTVSAHGALAEAGRARRDHKSVVDQQAAVIIVEQALSHERLTGAEAGIPLEQASTRQRRNSR